MRVAAQAEKETRDYPFIIFPGTLQLFTMEQMNTNYASASRLASRGVEYLCADSTLFGIPVSLYINYT